jgi:hypothetical protein
LNYGHAVRFAYSPARALVILIAGRSVVAWSLDGTPRMVGGIELLDVLEREPSPDATLN